MSDATQLDAEATITNLLMQETGEAIDDLQPSDDLNSDEQEVEATNEDSVEEAATNDVDEIEYLAAKFGVDAAQLHATENGIMFKAKVDGEIMSVPLTELAKSYQLQKHVNNKSEQLSQARKELDAAKAQVEHEARERLEKLETLSSYAEQQLLSEYKSVDWERLRATDPAEYAAAKQDYAVKAQNIQAMQRQAIEMKQQQAQQAQQQQQAALQEYLHVQQQQLLEKIPAWSNSETRANEVVELNNYLKTAYGFNDQELSQVYDSRLVLLARDAMNAKKASSVADKKLTSVPKFQKPGAAVSRTEQSKSNVNKIVTRAKRTGSTSDAVDAIAQLLGA